MRYLLSTATNNNPMRIPGFTIERHTAQHDQAGWEKESVDVWTIDMPSLEALHEFIDTVGHRVVISNRKLSPYYQSIFPNLVVNGSLTIYDGYMEG